MRISKASSAFLELAAESNKKVDSFTVVIASSALRMSLPPLCVSPLFCVCYLYGSQFLLQAASLTGISDPVLAGQELLKNGVYTKWVIVKMGPKGSILITNSSITCAPAFKVNIIDTVGCGDSFVAAVAFGFIHDLPLSYTLTLANAVGAATAMGCGAGRNVASLGKVLELLKESNLNEDDKFWDEVLNDNVNSQDMTVLSKMVVNGNSQVNRVSLQKVVSAVLPKLEFAPKKTGSFK
ncbi:hypothetical protein HAX54_044266 [Datura stramonium]|uniref:Carbohydrate kinase PfkB domain-containing protein n=1 Tax=Datura stramonium TaxID=4076 RepID=A0ABS8W4I5_DATST|nr:hypothetical protein [Datura stramonium]